MAESATSTIERTIAQVNGAGTGFLTVQEPGKWFNLSRFASPAPTIPPSGTTARVTIDGKGYVRAIEPMNLVPARDGGPSIPAEVRLALLQAAAAFLAPRAEAKSSDVLHTAEEWEAWVSRA